MVKRARVAAGSPLLWRGEIEVRDERRLERVNEPLSAAELQRLRHSVSRGRPYVIARRLIGVSAVRKALAVEHFGQSDYKNHIKIGDLLSFQQAL